MNRDQQFLLPPDMREWVPPTHPVWTVIEIVDTHLDTSAFHGSRRTGGAGRAGYDPDMLVTLLIWAWSRGDAVVPADRAGLLGGGVLPGDLRRRHPPIT
ncbi:hypothetical protein HJ581_0029620 [Rhodococcus opacus]|nr:hypothetical protein HJ581_0029620 [Rhodococcus opacus]